jgi:hypothetical protein
MGFMDKAKKLAEQAQQKLDEAQTQFNQGAAPQASPEDAGGVRYDEHGKPIQAPSPAGPTPDPAAPPASDAPGGVPASPAAPSAPTAEESGDEPPTRSGGDANTTPDPFKPLQ